MTWCQSPSYTNWCNPVLPMVLHMGRQPFDHMEEIHLVRRRDPAFPYMQLIHSTSSLSHSWLVQAKSRVTEYLCKCASQLFHVTCSWFTSHDWQVAIVCEHRETVKMGRKWACCPLSKRLWFKSPLLLFLSPYPEDNASVVAHCFPF